ncbi:MAG: hypothetical protein HOL68_11605 [Bacteroidetes Order II. Incertae sedis bacterium]|nr:hypothetical protein [Bacteroidetes Order II. bacterium]
MKHQLMFLFLAIVLSVPARSDVLSEWVGSEIDEHEAEYSELAMDLWRWSGNPPINNPSQK